VLIGVDPNEGQAEPDLERQNHKLQRAQRTRRKTSLRRINADEPGFNSKDKN
jgi:hypothetical protein